MTREEQEDVIQYLKNLRLIQSENFMKDGISKAIEALAKEPCEDTVSRKQVITEIKKWWRTALDAKGSPLICEIIKDLPPVTPQEPKTGHWIYESDKEHGHCSRCGAKEDLVNGKIYNYCRVCGARMAESEG